MTQKEPKASLDRARTAIADLLGDGFGIRIAPDPWGKWIEERHRKNALGVRESALSVSVRVMLFMSLFFIGIPWFFGLYSPELMTLAIYGVLWSGWSAATSIMTSRAVSEILERRVLPLLPEPALADLARDIEARYPKWRRLTVTWVVGAAAAGVSGWLVWTDDHLMSLGETVRTKWEVIAFLWWPEWLILFAAAASVVQVSSFYRLLPRHVVPALADSYRLDPANAALIQAMASVSRVILVFWLGIALSVAILLPASSWDWAYTFREVTPPIAIDDLFRFRTDSIPLFVMIEVTITCSLSLGVGVIIFLFAESDLRNAGREARLLTLEKIEREAGALLDRLGTLSDAQMKRLADLRTLQASIAAVTPYRSLAVSALSVLLPFLPLAGFLLQLR